jgi:hypothetical protein
MKRGEIEILGDKLVFNFGGLCAAAQLPLVGCEPGAEMAARQRDPLKVQLNSPQSPLFPR